jgi:hypothetical protein
MGRATRDPAPEEVIGSGPPPAARRLQAQAELQLPGRDPLLCRRR